LIIGFSVVVMVLGMMIVPGEFIISNEVYFTPFPDTDLIGLLIENTSNVPIVKTVLLLVFGIPFLMLVVAGVRMIFGIKRSSYIGVAALNIWLISLIILIIFSFRVARDFRYENDFTTNYPLEINSDVTLQVDLKAIDMEIPEEVEMINGDDWVVFRRNGEYSAMGQPELTISKSESDQFYLQILSQARGKNDSIAEARAEGLIYSFELTDSLLILDDHFFLGENKWRSQEMDIRLMVPVGRKIYLDDDLSTMLSYRNDFPRRAMTGKIYVMTDDGLKLPETAGSTDAGIVEGKQYSAGFGFSAVISTLYKHFI